MRFSLAISLLFWALTTFAAKEIPLYYGAQFINGYQDKTLRNEEMKTVLFNIVSGGHIKSPDVPDRITPSCTSSGLNSTNEDTISADPSPTKCVQHTMLGYDAARRKLFGQLHLKQTQNGMYYVKDVYCEHNFTDADFGGAPTFGPGMLPSSGNIVNTEHTWPQSRFTTRFAREMQKSDLHHLFPTDSEMNSHRGSLRFGNVAEEAEQQKCKQNKLGRQSEGGIIFEVADSQKGNTARAIFYFATRYQMKVSPSEETALRQWNILDPVDSEEAERNAQIETLQGNRNPFIDFTDLVDRIDHF